MIRTILLLLIFTGHLGAQLPQFKEVSRAAGLTVPHISTPDKQYIVESMSGGVGLIDCDNDGKLDIIVANGSTIDHFRQGGDPMITLYHQDADFKFSNITQAAGLTRKGWGMGVAVADYDNDGLPDIYVTGYGGNALYHNLGNCKFEDVTDKAGVAAGGFSTGAAWADYDRDGRVDLFVSRYVHFDMNKLPTFGSDEKTCRFKGIRVQCGPWGMQGESDLLFHNRGDGTFEEVSKKAGVDDPDRYYGLGVNGATTTMTAGLTSTSPMIPVRIISITTNTTEPLKKSACWPALRSAAMASSKARWAWIGATTCTTAAWECSSRISPSSLTRSIATWAKANSATSAGLQNWRSRHIRMWDGERDLSISRTRDWLDIFIANGHVYPQMDQIAGAARYAEPMQLFRNKGDGTFEDISSVLAGVPGASRRGAAFGDLKNDGNIDVVLLDMDGPPQLLLNVTSNHNHRVLFKLAGVKSNKMAVGAKVAVTTGKIVQTSEVRAGGSYLSSNDPRLHFGLGADARMSQIEIRWPMGEKEVLKDLSADFIYTVTEGKGITDKQALSPVE